MSSPRPGTCKARRTGPPGSRARPACGQMNMPWESSATSRMIDRAMRKAKARKPRIEKAIGRIRQLLAQDCMSSYGRFSTVPRYRFPRTTARRLPRITGFGGSSPTASRPSWVTRSAALPTATRMRSSKSTSTAGGPMTSGGSKASSRPSVSPPHLSSNCAAQSSATGVHHADRLPAEFRRHTRDEMGRGLLRPGRIRQAAGAAGQQRRVGPVPADRSGILGVPAVERPAVECGRRPADQHAAQPERSASSFQVRLYDALPTFRIVLIDQTVASFSPYPMAPGTQRARTGWEAPHIVLTAPHRGRWPRPSKMLFEETWGTATPLTPSAGEQATSSAR